MTRISDPGGFAALHDRLAFARGHRRIALLEELERRVAACAEDETPVPGWAHAALVMLDDERREAWFDNVPV